MKKVIKIIAYNIIFILIVLLFAEAICLVKYYNFLNTNMPKIVKYLKIAENTEKLTLKDIIENKYKKRIFFVASEFRPPQGLDYFKDTKDTSPLVLLGCSYNYGYGLETDETFQSFLSKQTKRPVYNLSLIGAGPREALYILGTAKARTSLLPNVKHVKYFIFTYISSHQKRLYENFRLHVPNFKYDRSYTKLTYYKDYPNNKTCLIPELMKLYSIQMLDSENNFKLLKLYFTYINKYIKKNYDNYDEPTKLIVFVYDYNEIFKWEELEKEGIIVVKIKDLSEENFFLPQYMLNDKNHPNSKTWGIITPLLIKKIDL